MSKKVRLITETAVLLALLVTVQYLTRSFGQLITGSCVNMVLAVGAIMCGVYGGGALALLSPFLAYFLGIGPQLLPIVPAIALGNFVYVILISLICGSKELKPVRAVAGIIVGSVVKFVTLYIVVVKVLCNVLTLKEQQIATFTAMFSYPQLITALVGGAVALLAASVLKKAVKD